MHYLSDMKEAARRQAERQKLPTGQQWHLVVWFLYQRFPQPWVADNHLLLDLNRFSGSQNTDNGPYSSSSQGLLMPLQQHSTAVVRRALKALVDVLH